MPELDVRPATDADIEQLEPLVEDSLGRLQTLRGGPALLDAVGVSPAAGTATIARLLCGAAPVTYVAVLDGAVVGFAVAVRDPGGLALTGIHTARSLRRRRIGTALLDALRAHARASGERFEALALPGDQTVKSLLESAGFRARLLRMSDDR